MTHVKRILHYSKDCPEIIHLTAVDNKLGFLIDNVGEYTLTLRTDHTAAIIRAIVGQQLSFKAATTIWTRLEILCGDITPKAILSVTDDELRAVGLSRTKASYAKDFSMKVLSEEINFEVLRYQDDETIINTLTKVKGIGKWTAEMFLIFSLGRSDIMALDDVGLRRSMKWLYRLSELPDIQTMKNISDKWKPHRTTASLFLWEAVNKGYC